MPLFVRKVFSADDLLTVNYRQVPTIEAYRPYLKEAINTPHCSTSRIVAILLVTLGEKAAKILLDEQPRVVLTMAGELIEDLLRGYGQLREKDIQTSLVVNLVAQCAQAQPLSKLKRYQYAEDLIRRCDFDAGYKGVIKKALFDKDVLNSRHLVIQYM